MRRIGPRRSGGLLFSGSVIAVFDSVILEVARGYQGAPLAQVRHGWSRSTTKLQRSLWYVPTNEQEQVLSNEVQERPTISLVVGTAGHIDHGKSSLVHRLTGVHPSRLKEEQERGMTIDIGYAELDVTDQVKAGIIDVPGHEKFIRNMVAGASGVDFVLLVVAADDGVMPQ
ncbi:MAG: 50S ribosome-binding GTPase, partial [Planctomycetes bacterium]|nr:50S ribosome-binding GTPase [Planctomycetota bacterium]